MAERITANAPQHTDWQGRTIFRITLSEGDTYDLFAGDVVEHGERSDTKGSFRWTMDPDDIRKYGTRVTEEDDD